MKITFKLDSGTETTTTPDQLMLNNFGGNIALGYRVDGDHMVPVLFFPGQVFTPEALKAHDAAVLEKAHAAAIAAAQKAAITPPKQEGLGAVESEPTTHGGGSDPMGD